MPAAATACWPSPSSFQLVSGVAISAAVLRFYEGFDNASTVQQFHYTFITMGVITIISALMFMLLRAKDGRNLISERHKR